MSRKKGTKKEAVGFFLGLLLVLAITFVFIASLYLTNTFIQFLLLMASINIVIAMIVFRKYFR